MKGYPMRRLVTLMTILLLCAVPVLAQEPQKMDPLLQCQAQLAETTWSYETLHKDRQEKERLRDKSEVRAYILDREVQRLRKQLHDIQEAAKQEAAKKETDKAGQ